MVAIEGDRLPDGQEVDSLLSSMLRSEQVLTLLFPEMKIYYIIATLDLIIISLDKIEVMERSEETKNFIDNLKNKV